MMKQQVYFGLNTLSKLADVLEYKKVKKVFLVTGKKSYVLSGAKKKIALLLDGYNVFHFADFTVNPQLNDVLVGITHCRAFEPGIVIAVGGGSVIDMAKLVAAFSQQIRKPLGYIKKNKPLNRKPLPLIAIPTTSGSGSEATHFAVVYYKKTKHSLADASILPEFALVDPQLTFSLSSKQTASTGLDAFSQAIEAYWSVNSTSESQNYSKKAIKKILAFLETAVAQPHNKEARTAMSEASYLAGKAINIAKTTACHALSYTLTSYFGLTHGHAVGLSLGPMLEYNSKVTEATLADPRGLSYVQKTVRSVITLLGCNTAAQARERIQQLIRNLGLEVHLSRLGIASEKDVNLILDTVNLERLKNNPRTLDRSNLKKILQTCL